MSLMTCSCVCWHRHAVYLVVADEAFGRQIPFSFLDRVRDEFDERFKEKGLKASAHSLDRSFGPRLKAHMEYCMAHPEELTKIAGIQKKVAEVKDVMVENIEKVLERGEKIEVLVDKTDELRQHADQFQRKGKLLRSKMFWQNMRMKIAIFCCVLLLAVVIFLLVCFSGGNNCTKHK
uniref:V-SNARE coiled-coil homology domain-containing protein n=1 Tax=Polytomella parva TaxID=51329 RepID=A0A7S0YI16_9CHLO|mmetsp:Transcript_21383/g.38200  ORF Transcript_21383/g.38200 Transcript_21383/m.38200 type:complete len:177 (+) Transcript_21383:268-798(+)